MANRTGGGINSRVVSETKAFKQEPRPHGVSIGATSRLGSMVGEGTPYKAIYNQQAYTNPIGPTQCECKPGGGRTVMPSGSQARTPAAKTTIGPSGRSLFK
jgi:hypothetical protein